MKISLEAQVELDRDVREDRIGIAKDYADTFAAKYGLNPITIQSMISRKRRDLGLQRSYRKVTNGRGGPVSEITIEEYAAVCMAADAFGKMMGYEEPVQLTHEILDELARCARTAADRTFPKADEPVEHESR